MRINLGEVGAHVRAARAGGWEARFGVYLPGIRYDGGYRLELRVIHESDQFVREVPAAQVWMSWRGGSALDLWEAVVPLADGLGHFGQPGRYLYRYRLFRDGEALAFAFSDPFGREAGIGTLSAFTLDPDGAPFVWTDDDFRVSEIDELVVYELNVREFNRDFAGVVAQLGYLRGLGVNALELMPVTNVKEDVEWGYTPLAYFAPDDRLGGASGLKRLVNACHAHGVAVIVDAVYAHAHPEFAYNIVYDVSRAPNPMMGPFAGEFFSRPGIDYAKPFATDYFLQLNQYWLEEYHVDGFRYDYVPGMYNGDPAGPGYPDLVYRTYEHSKGLARFDAGDGRSRIIQCAEHLPDPVGILSKTYSNCCWQNGLMNRARDMGTWGYVSAEFAHLLDPEFVGYPSEYHNPATGETLPVAPFQYLETHDHRRFINEFGTTTLSDLLGEAYGDRDRFFKVQPYVIGLYTAKGIPMLWQGQEFAENWGLPSSGLGRNLFERPLHWEYFSDDQGRALVRLYRILGSLRRSRRALRARGFFYYEYDPEHFRARVIVFRREAPATANAAAECLVVVLNFSDSAAEVWVPLPAAGQWRELIDGNAAVQAAQAGDHVRIQVSANYGGVYELV
jgi:1,4-alpha-glucan branching enzyme